MGRDTEFALNIITRFENDHIYPEIVKSMSMAKLLGKANEVGRILG